MKSSSVLIIKRRESSKVTPTESIVNLSELITINDLTRSKDGLLCSHQGGCYDRIAPQSNGVLFVGAILRCIYLINLRSIVSSLLLYCRRVAKLKNIFFIALNPKYIQ